HMSADSRGKRLILREPIADFVNVAQELRQIVGTARDIRRAVKGDAEALARLREFYVGPKNDAVDDDGVLLFATNMVTGSLTHALWDARPNVYDRFLAEDVRVDPGTIRIGILAETLQQVCYLQIALALSEREPIEVCPECGRVFVVEDARQRFCEPKCANR